MRIAFLIPMSLESPSGIRYAAMARALSQRGHQVTVLALHHNLQPSTRRLMKQNGLQVQYAGQMLVRKVGNHKFYYSTPALARVAIASTWQLMRRVVRLNCDLVHLGKPQPVNGLAGLIGWRLLRNRALYLDCDDYEVESNRLASPWLRGMVRLFEDGLPRFTTGLTTNTRFTEERYVKLGIPPDRIAYVPNGIDRDRFAMPSRARVDHLRQQWEIQDRQVVGYVGSLSLTSHAVDLLLEGFRQLMNQHDNLVLLVVGGGEDFDTVRKLATAKGLGRSVRFVGRIPPTDTPAYYAMADVTVDPVNDDLVARARSPLKIVESLAVGTPVVTGDVGDRRQMLADERAGVLVTPGDPKALAEGLAQVLDNPDRAEELSRGALAQREHFYWDRLVDPVIQLYESAGNRLSP
jgi:glycosyltransferase involved in cell wall biosynthesis